MALHTLWPTNAMQVVKQLAQLYHNTGAPTKAVELLELQLANFYNQIDLTHINMLTDLYMGMVSGAKVPGVGMV